MLPLEGQLSLLSEYLHIIRPSLFTPALVGWLKTLKMVEIKLPLSLCYNGGSQIHLWLHRTPELHTEIQFEATNSTGAADSPGAE